MEEGMGEVSGQKMLCEADCPAARTVLEARHAGRYAPRARNSRQHMRLAALLSFAALTTEASGATNSSCSWLPWHPAQVAANSSDADAAIIQTPPHICKGSSFITDFYANISDADGPFESLRYLSARCSDGEFLGYYALYGDTGLEESVASSRAGFKALSGSAGGILESLGEVSEPAHAWTDSCVSGSLISGYQINFAPGEPIKQIRLLCSNLDASDCGGQLAAGPAGQAMASAPGLDYPTSPSPAAAASYIVFAIQWASSQNLSIAQVQAGVQALRVLRASTVKPLGRECSASVGDDQGAYVQCFQAGPVSSDAALIIVSSLRDPATELDFQKALATMGVSITAPKFLFAAVSGRALGGFVSSTPPMQPAQIAPMPMPDDGGVRTGLIVGCVIAGVLGIMLIALLALVWLFCKRRQSRRRVRSPESGRKRELSLGALDGSLPIKPALAATAPSNASTDLIRASPFKSPFGEWPPKPAQVWDPQQSWASAMEGDGAPPFDAVAAERRARAQKLQGAPRSAPIPSGADVGLPGHGVLWTVQPPKSIADYIPPCFTPPLPPSEAKSRPRWLHQDSDEVLEAGQSVWRVMHEDVSDIPTRPLGLSESANASGQDSSRQPSSSTESPALGQPADRLLDLVTTEDWEIRPSDLQICRDRYGRYVELGTGAFGKVYKALLHDVTEVAVKRLEASSGAQRTLFLREIQIHKRCRSAHVVQFLGACIQSNCMFLVTELMDTSLDRNIHDEKQPFTWETEGKRIALDVAHALAYLHKQRVVHLDIKSRNVLLNKEGRAKIADVGLSQVLQNTYLSQVDSLGTFAYAAPELLSGGSNCSTKADIWSYGILLHEMVTREHPKRGALSDRRPEHCPKHIDRLIQQCIEREPADRPSAKVIVRVLQAEDAEAAAAILDANAPDETLQSGGGGLEARRRCDDCSRDSRQMKRMASMPDLLAARLTRWSCS